MVNTSRQQQHTAVKTLLIICGNIYHLPFNHLCLLAHAEAAIVLGPLRAVVGLARGGVDGGAAGLGRAATTAVAPAPAVVAAAATATSAGDKCLTRESSIAGSL